MKNLIAFNANINKKDNNGKKKIIILCMWIWKKEQLNV